MKRFPYPLKTTKITAYGREYCPYCQRLKFFLEQLYPNDQSKNYKYYNIDKLIENKQAKDFDDFKEKMEPFIADYQTIPIIFLQGEFIGGLDNFIEIITLIIKKELPSTKVEKLLDSLKSKKNISIEKRVDTLLKKLQSIK